MSLASLVKELRERTGAGMMDCKKALEAVDSDMDKAIEWLRENGIAKAAKKGDRIAAEGLTNIVVSNNKAVIYELNSETDFVAKNDQFLELLNTVGNALVNSSAKTLDEGLDIVIGDDKLVDIIDRGTATIGEKINLRRFTIIEKNDDQIFANYSHMGGKISVLVIASGSDEQTLRNVAMHIAAINPQYLSADMVDSQIVEKEREMLTKEALAEGKPANIVEKMIEGRIKKFLKEICLLDQQFVMENDKTVASVLLSAGLKINTYTRYEVGEGIEKQEVDFAAEVAAQARV